MEKQFEGVFELFDLSVRRLRNGNKLRIVFELSEDLDVEKRLIEFRGCNVKATITNEQEQKRKTDNVTVQDTFEVFDLSCRRLRNGDKLRLTLENMYDKDGEIAAVKLRYQNCKVFLEKIEEELDFEGGESEEGDEA